jgi:hypothetical protein
MQRDNAAKLDAFEPFDQEREFVDRRSAERRQKTVAVANDKRVGDRRSGMERRFFSTARTLVAREDPRMMWAYAESLAHGMSEWAAAIIAAIQSLKPPVPGAQPSGDPEQQGAARLHDVLSARRANVGKYAEPFLQQWKGGAKAPTIIELVWQPKPPVHPHDDIQPLSVQVKDVNGQPVGKDVPVTFAVTSGCGTITGGGQQGVEIIESKTAADGIARLDRWTLGPKAGLNVLSVTVGGCSKDFILTSI